MEATQRDAIWKALNDDAKKLIQEGPSDDPGLRRLREEMKKCNELFTELQQKASRGDGKISYVPYEVAVSSLIAVADMTSLCVEKRVI